MKPALTLSLISLAALLGLAPLSARADDGEEARKLVEVRRSGESRGEPRAEELHNVRRGAPPWSNGRDSYGRDYGRDGYRHDDHGRYDRDHRHHDGCGCAEWIPGHYETRRERIVVPAVTERRWCPEVTERVWVEALYENRHVPAVVERVWVPGRHERVWVPARYEARFDSRGRRVEFCIEGGHYEDRHTPGRWVERIVHPARTERHCVREGHWATRVVSPGRWDTVVVRPERVEYRTVRVWVPGRRA